GGDLADIREQLRAVMLAPFERQQLLSESEYRAFRIIEEEVAVGRRGCRGRDLADVREQLRAVMLAPFERQRLLSTSEYRAFRLIEEEVAAGREGWRVFAQTSMGEMLRSPSRSAFRSINSKRIDILVVDAGGWPLLAVEFQHEGHDQGDAAGRDAVKREALRKAGVPYLEICATDADELIRSRVRERLGGALAASAKGPRG
ncbi:MAG TPA: DUF2726 domain-containing protein, partial [Hyphomicrobiaceae bacterium]|nr:DUF2726 domain-containing protein [Hyphomicrobiaceae bacterium]